MENRKFDRRRFIKSGFLGLAGTAAGSAFLKAGPKYSYKPREEKEKFIYRTLGKTGFKLPVVSMGVMNADNPNLVAAALDSGITLLDTAHGYQKGKNEEIQKIEIYKTEKGKTYILIVTNKGVYQEEVK